MRKSIISSVFCSIVLLSTTSAHAQSSDYVVVGSHIDNVRDQSNIFQVAADCSNNAVCVAAAKAASAYLGIPIDRAVSVAAALSTNRDGEGTFMTVSLPAGYSYCSASMTMTSIVPHDGDRGSTFLGRADDRSFYMETWTPVQGWGEGRSWVEADVSIVGVRDYLAEGSYQSGQCRRPGSRALFYCRGGGCVNTVDQGQSVPTGYSPPANGRN